MKKLSLLLLLIVVSCTSEPIKSEYHKYNITWYTSFEDNSLTITNLSNNDTILTNNKCGSYNVELKRGNKYHINIIQDKLTNTNRKSTEVKIVDLELNKIVDTLYTEKCIKNYGYYINVY